MSDRVMLRLAEQDRDKLIGQIRARIRAGYDLDLCMEEVAGRQCTRGAQLDGRLLGLVGFCPQHWDRHIRVMDEPGRIQTQMERDRRIADALEEDKQRQAENPKDYGVYVLYDAHLKRAKIGMTGNKSARISGVKAGAGLSLEMLAWIPSDGWNEARNLEAALHELFAEQRIGKREWFNVDDVDAFLKKIMEER